MVSVAPRSTEGTSRTHRESALDRAPSRAPTVKPPERTTGFAARDRFELQARSALERSPSDGLTPRVLTPRTRDVATTRQFTARDDGSTVTVTRGAPPAAPTTLAPGDVVPNDPAHPTVAEYRVGPPTRPDIRHDNGFLQNPDDPSDPNPIATVPAGPADYAKRAEWEAKLAAARLAQGVPFVPHNDIGDGLDAYDHFLHGNGADRNFDYNGFVENDESGKVVLQNTTRDAQTAAEAQYAAMVAADPSLAGKTVTFDITGGPIPVGADGSYPYPQTENWQKAIGAHVIWNSASVTVTPPSEPGGKPQFEMNLTVHAEDRYNFNPGAADIATGTPDADNGQLERTGLGHQYMNYGTLERTVTWDQGHIEDAKSSNPNSR